MKRKTSYEQWINLEALDKIQYWFKRKLFSQPWMKRYYYSLIKRIYSQLASHVTLKYEKHSLWRQEYDCNQHSTGLHRENDQTVPISENRIIWVENGRASTDMLWTNKFVCYSIIVKNQQHNWEKSMKLKVDSLKRSLKLTVLYLGWLRKREKTRITKIRSETLLFLLTLLLTLQEF